MNPRKASVHELRASFVEGMSREELRVWQLRWDSEHNVEDMREVDPPFVIGPSTARWFGIADISSMDGMIRDGKTYRHCANAGVLIRKDFFEWIVDRLRTDASASIRAKRARVNAGEQLPGFG